jgi:hypothetical protein
MTSIFSKPNIKKQQPTNCTEGATAYLNNTHSKQKTGKNINIIDSISDNNTQDDDEEIYDYGVGAAVDDTEQMVLYIDDIKSSIPVDAVNVPNEKLEKTHTEVRWRFFDLKGRKLIEISKKSPDKKRVYVDNTGKWVDYELKGNWNKFLIGSKYYYCL